MGYRNWWTIDAYYMEVVALLKIWPRVISICRTICKSTNCSGSTICFTGVNTV